MTTEERVRTPRERARAAAVDDIKRLARQQIADAGAGGLSLREIAKEMGLVSSAIYRYVPSRDALLTELISEAYDRLGEAAEAADARHPRDALADRWRAIAHALRDWARAHPTDYTLVYGPPVMGYHAPPQTYAPAQRWIEIMIDILRRGALEEAPPAAPSDPELATQLETLAARRSPGSPPGALAAALLAWAELHGLVALEIYGQTAFVLDGADRLFAYGVEQQVTKLGLLTRPT